MVWRQQPHINNINNCIHDFQGWVIAYACKFRSDFDREFFIRNGYEMIPAAGDVIITDIQSVYLGQK